MRNRLLFVLVLNLCLLASNAAAQNVTITTATRPIYLGQQGGVFYDRPVQQTDVAAAWKNGVFADFWTSTGFNSKKDFGKEIDLVLGRAGKLGKLNYSTDVAYFIVQGIDVANWNGQLSAGPFFAKVEGYAPVQKGGPRKGLIVSVGEQVSFAPSKRVSFSIMQLMKHDSGAFGFDKMWLYQGRLGLNLALSEKLTVGTAMRWSLPFPDEGIDDERKGKIVWELNLSRTLK